MKLFTYLIPPGFILLSLLLWLTGCSNQANTSITQVFYVFGTEVQVQIVDTPKPQADKAIQAVEQRFHRFHQAWHAWEKGGILTKINDAIAAGHPIEVADSVKQFILKSQQLAAESDYLFDPGIGGLVALWGFHSEDWQGPPPSEKAIQAWRKSRPSIADVYFEGSKLYSRNPKLRLDFGGNAKGLALDIAIDTLQKAGIENAIVNIGGDMRIIGSKNPHNHQAWRIGLQDPQAPETVLASLEIEGDESIVTSGNYQRYFVWNGRRYSHILNPNTGYPADHFLSVTVVHPDATTADAAATALMVAGPADWERTARQMGISQAFMVDEHRRFYSTPAMRARLQLTAKPVVSPNTETKETK